MGYEAGMGGRADEGELVDARGESDEVTGIRVRSQHLGITTGTVLDSVGTSWDSFVSNFSSMGVEAVVILLEMLTTGTALRAGARGVEVDVWGWG